MSDVTERIPEIIEIRDPEINVESIMARIRENIQQRKQTHPELFDLELPTFPVGGPPPDDVTDAGALAFNLRQALVTADEIGVMMSPVKSPLPVIGPLWAAFKRQMHGLVLYYVNTLAAKQIKFNRHVAHVLQRIVGQGTTEEIVALRQEIEVLRARIEQLEQATSTDQTET